jgi:hypothetical protein
MTTIPELTWTTVGADFETFRPEILAAIDTIEWRPLEGSWPASPGLGIQEVIRQLRLPRVQQAGIATDVIDDRYSLYGIEAQYTNGRARVFVIDTGSCLTPVASGLIQEDGE